MRDSSCGERTMQLPSRQIPLIGDSDLGVGGGVCVWEGGRDGERGGGRTEAATVASGDGLERQG
jgi:hypothetical protein